MNPYLIGVLVALAIARVVYLLQRDRFTMPQVNDDIVLAYWNPPRPAYDPYAIRRAYEQQAEARERAEFAPLKEQLEAIVKTELTELGAAPEYIEKVTDDLARFGRPRF